MAQASEVTAEVSSARLEEIRSWANERASTWYGRDGEDRLEFDGVPTGRAVRIEVFNLLVSIALRHAGLASDVDRNGITSWLKQRGADRPVRAWTMRMGMAFRRRPTRQYELAVVSEMATPSALLAVSEIVQCFEPGASVALAADPRAARYWASRGVPTDPVLLSLTDELRMLRRARSRFEVIWRKVIDEPPRFEFRDASLGGVVMPRLARLLARSVPWLHVERLALRQAIERAEPRVVLLASDQHRIGVLATVEARLAGIPTAVMQHGLPQHDVGYVPVAADRVLAWSSQAMDWFVARGTDPRRVTIVGNPAFDTSRRIGANRDTSHLGAATRVVLALTPSTRDVNSSIVRTALDALQQVPGVELTVKLHPGDGDWQYVREIVGAHGASTRVAIAHREPLAPLLQQAAVTWLHRSSVALESLAAGTPVVIAAADAPSTADLELRGLGLPVARSSNELAALTVNLLETGGRAAYFAARPIEAYAGPANGAAAERARDVLKELMASRSVLPA